LQIKTKIVSCHTAVSKPVKQEINSRQGPAWLPDIVCNLYLVKCFENVNSSTTAELREEISAGIQEIREDLNFV
jgi:hypothetical protein